jgi:hypothetical protein
MLKSGKMMLDLYSNQFIVLSNETQNENLFGSEVLTKDVMIGSIGCKGTII